MESNYEAGERVSLTKPYTLGGINCTFIPSGEFVLLVDGPYKTLKYGSTIFSWDILSPYGKLIKITEDYF
jgi:hypothetical protein